MFKRVVISALALGLVLGSGYVMMAQADPSMEKAPMATDGATQWEQFAEQGKTLSDQAFKMTRADHNPKKKDYYKAAELYTQAATAYQQAKVMLTTPGVYSTPSAEDTKQASELEKKANLMQFNSRQAFSAARNRDIRNMD